MIRMNFLRKIFFIGLILLSSFSFVWAEWDDTKIKDALLWNDGVAIGSDSIVSDGNAVNFEDGFLFLDVVFAFVKESISGLLMLIALGVFLFIGIRLSVARWNPEEFKKAMMQFVYAVVWIFIVFVAWAAVKLVAGLNIG